MKKLLSILFICLMIATPALAENENQLRAQASEDMKLAKELLGQARIFLTQEKTKANLQSAISLYTRAGQLLERAMTIYTQLAPDHASEDEIANAENGVQFCIGSIREIQQHMPKENEEDPSHA